MSPVDANGWTKQRGARRALAQESMGFSAALVEQPVDHMPAVYRKAKATRAWRSRPFLVVLWSDERGYHRLSCQRTTLRADGQWEDGITWDDLMRLKREAGFGDRWAIEIYPDDANVVNVANMRHLWLWHEAPPCAWKAGT